MRFGDIEDIAYTPGRSYAFVNYKKEEDAVIAFRGLQSYIVAGNPIRIEFTMGFSVKNYLLTICFRLQIFSSRALSICCLCAPFISYLNREKFQHTC